MWQSDNQFVQLLLLLSIFISSQSAPHSPSNNVKIIEGVEATPGEFPYIVSIQDSINHVCGGTLVSMSRVITGAHCAIAFTSLHDIHVVAGAFLLRDALRGIQQLRQVKNITYHPNYDSTNLLNHDIAVIELKEPFTPEGGNISALPYASRNQQYSGLCQIAGWGFTNSMPVYSEKLMKGNLSINSQTECSSIFNPDFDPNYQICAGGLNGENVDPCEGDMGGPLICSNTDGSKYFAGVTSWSVMACRVGRPRATVYMAIAKYRTWLDSLPSGGNDGPTTTASTTTKATTARIIASENQETDESLKRNDDVIDEGKHDHEGDAEEAMGNSKREDGC